MVEDSTKNARVKAQAIDLQQIVSERVEKTLAPRNPKMNIFLGNGSILLLIHACGHCPDVTLQWPIEWARLSKPKNQRPNLDYLSS